MAEKDVSELLRKLQEASTPQELEALGAQFAAPYEKWLIYKHPALGDKRLFFKKEKNVDGIEGELTLRYNAIQ